jgi:hypothetical protein
MATGAGDPFAGSEKDRLRYAGRALGTQAPEQLTELHKFGERRRLPKYTVAPSTFESLGLTFE